MWSGLVWSGVGTRRVRTGQEPKGFKFPVPPHRFPPPPPPPPHLYMFHFQTQRTHFRSEISLSTRPITWSDLHVQKQNISRANSEPEIGAEPDLGNVTRQLGIFRGAKTPDVQTRESLMYFAQTDGLMDYQVVIDSDKKKNISHYYGGLERSLYASWHGWSCRLCNRFCITDLTCHWCMWVCIFLLS